MTREEAKSFLIDISYKLGNMAIEYLTEKDGEKMREAIEALDQEPCASEKAYIEGYYDAKICELNIRKKELENQLNMSVQNNIDNEMGMCCISKYKNRK